MPLARTLGYTTVRREAHSGFIQLTPGETNEQALVIYPDHGPAVIEQQAPQSGFDSRAAKRAIAFFLSPVETHFANDFMMGHESIPRMPNTPAGRLSQQDDRRNVAIPPRISYGALVGEADGVAPYGLE